MNIYDIMILIVIVAAVALAVITLVRRRGQCNCGNCAKSCNCRKGDRIDNRGDCCDCKKED